MKSNAAESGKRARMTICYDRTWNYKLKHSKRNMKESKENEEEDEEKKKMVGTKKCECQFKLFVKHAKDDSWHVRFECGVHNHRLTNSLVGVANAGRLNA
ncbi:hypothetical protein Scep_004237 [Stephania cephalantha]|uniref:FAR1 domain-containing protein n=1 Tax=Stephania cephalantha TaxID=152367 RepID=A0AAP0KS27_9MAGN